MLKCRRLTGFQIIHNENYSVVELMKLGQNILGRRHVQPSVVGTLKQMQVEGTFETGTHLITIHDPISTDNGNLRMALYGSFLPVPDKDPFPEVNQADFDPSSMPGAVRPMAGDDIVLYKDRPMMQLTVVNKGTRAIHVSSKNYPSSFVLITNKYLGWFSLSLHGDKSRFGIRQTESVRLSPGSAFRRIHAIRTRRAHDR